MHRRKTSNALNASVRYEQKRLQRLSETVLANNRITGTQVVRQGIPGRRTSYTESPSAIGAELVARYRLGAVGWRIGDVAVMRHLRLERKSLIYS